MKLFRFSTLFLLLTFAVNMIYAEKGVSIVNWNVQTFFDAVTEGTEYSDFKKSSVWNTEKYDERVKKLSDAIKTMDADIFVLEEIENRGVVQDLANRLEDRSFNGRKNWKYAVFAKNPGDSIGCAVLSRFPVKNVFVHNLDLRTEKENQPSMRPVIQAEIQKDDFCFVLLVNHWKSKSGGEEKSEVWRNWQEKLLAGIFEKETSEGKLVFASGDFNRDISEFTLRENGSSVILLNGSFPVISPWIISGGNYIQPGSYYFNNEWERIDHFFASEGIEISAFHPETSGPWYSEEGKPDRYIIYKGTGWSDHLPVFCRISRKE